MADTTALLKRLKQLKDKPNYDVDFSFTNYTPAQLRINFASAVTHKYDTFGETYRDTRFHDAPTLHERYIANCTCSRSCHCGERIASKPADLTPSQWREALAEERQADYVSAQYQKALNMNLRREKLAAFGASAIEFGVKSEELYFYRSQFVSPTYTTDLSMTQEKYHKRFYPYEYAQAKNAILAGTLPEIYRRQKGYAQHAPQPRGFDLVNQNRVINAYDSRRGNACENSQVLLTASYKLKAQQ